MGVLILAVQIFVMQDTYTWSDLIHCRLVWLFAANRNISAVIKCYIHVYVKKWEQFGKKKSTQARCTHLKLTS